MERELFTWDGWDGDQALLQFYKAQLVRPVGPYPAGATFDCVTIDLINGVLTLYQQDAQPVACFKLRFSVGEPLPLPDPLEPPTGDTHD